MNNITKSIHDEPGWDGIHVCTDCGKGISKLTSESYKGKCVTCYKKLEPITESEYRNFVELRKKINELILAKVTQLSLIIHNRTPIGSCVDYDFEEENGRIIVQFEEYHCGEADYDTFRLPLQFLFDESYPEKYKLIYQEEQRIEREEREKKKKEMDEKKKQEWEEYERREYERLKLKFEKKE